MEWPNTGFCSYIKFSILRHKHFAAADLPPRWAEQAGLVVGFFERCGFNRHGATVAANQIGAGAQVLEQLFDQSGDRLRALFAGGGGGGGGTVTSARQTFPDPADVDYRHRWNQTLPFMRFQDSAHRLETRYQPKHMSAGLIKLPLSAATEAVRPMCGLVIAKAGGGGEVCWLYVAPHAYGVPVFQLLERLLAFVRIGVWTRKLLPETSCASVLPLKRSDRASWTGQGRGWRWRRR